MDNHSLTYRLHCGNNKEFLPSLPENSVDSIITDPPYGLGAPPNARDMLSDWLKSGSHDKSGKGFMGASWDAFVPPPALWAECFRVLKPGGHLLAFGGTRTYDLLVLGLRLAGFDIRDQIAWVYAQGMPKSKNLGNGWGTTLKPAMEPIVVARKPFAGPVTQLFNETGMGGLNIDECRVPAGTSAGRFPANLIHDGSPDVLSCFPETKKGGDVRSHYSRKQKACYGQYPPTNLFESYGDSGSASRFFYCAKATQKDREDGLEEEGREPSYSNAHPTVKPTDLMRWLCRLVTPPGGVVLDPFMGSGSTGKAAIYEGFHFLGVDCEKQYVEIAEKRIAKAFKEVSTRERNKA